MSSRGREEHFASLTCVALVIEALGLENVSPYEEIASFGLGVAFGMVIIGVIFTSRYSAQIRNLKLRLLEKLKK